MFIYFCWCEEDGNHDDYGYVIWWLLYTDDSCGGNDDDDEFNNTYEYVNIYGLKDMNMYVYISRWW